MSEINKGLSEDDINFQRPSVAPSEKGALVVVANTLPGRVRNGELVHSSGGLVTAMEPLVRHEATTNGHKPKWFALHNATDEKEGLAEALRTSPTREHVDMHTAGVSDEVFNLHYKGWANGTLWGALHDMPENMVYSPEARVASEYASAVLAKGISDNTTEGDRIFVQDYHLIRLGHHLRERRPKQRIGFFLHTPTASPGVFEQIPHNQDLLEGFLAYDEVGLQSRKNLNKFVETIDRLRPHDVHLVREADGSVIATTHDSRTRIVANHISFDPHEFLRQANSPTALAEAERIRAAFNGVVIAHDASRTDYTKGIPERLDALDLFFSQHPDMLGSFTQILTLAQARTGIPAYDRLVDTIAEKITTLNEKYGKDGWFPVVQTGSLERIPLVAHYRAVDGSITSPLADGYNLAFAEGAVAGRDKRFNAVSEHAGIAEVMEGAAILFDPRDTQQFADTFDKALQMSDEEQEAQTAEIRKRVYAKTIVDWGEIAKDGFAKMKR